MVSRWASPRHAQSERKEQSQRCWPQALEAEGHGPRAYRLDPIAFVAPQRHRPRTASARLQLRAAEESAAWGAAFGSFRKTHRRKADCCGWLAARIAQDERPRRCARP